MKNSTSSLKKISTIRVISLPLFVALAIFLLSGYARAERRPIAPGDNFPNLSFKDILSKEDQAYLGIEREKGFFVADIQGNLFIFEIFSTYCMSCPRNVPVLNQVYSTIKGDPKLRGKVKVVAVAVGNTGKEAESYKQEYKVLYPILTDFAFVLHKALGNPRVPYTVVVKRDIRVKSVAVYTHMGVLESADTLLNEVQKFLRQKPTLK